MTKGLKFSTRSNKSVIYIIAFVIIVTGFFIFFNLGNLLPDNSQIFNTPKGQISYIGSTKIAIKRWEYNKEKGFMEVELNYSEADDSVDSAFKFSAKPESYPKMKLPIKTIITTDDTYIIHINDIPKDYKAIALKVTQTANNTDDTGDTSDVDSSSDSSDDFSTSSLNSSTSSSVTSQTTEATLYCDYRKVKVNNTLTTETRKKYLITLTKQDIKTLNLNMKKIRNNIDKNNSMIKSYNDKIANLNNNIQYEIQEEQQKTLSEIDSCNTKIKNLNDANTSLESQKELVKQKIEKLNLEINNIKK
ncbi:MAG: hypothetical protein PHX70_13740 [Clostridium sp.]|nr:hypothetical protein [Clostridium sp.]